MCENSRHPQSKWAFIDKCILAVGPLVVLVFVFIDTMKVRQAP